jgi:HD-GYP domain-containing protein (c-di-GMP phosphodiesterase class II)
MFLVFIFYVVLFEVWLRLAPDPTWGGVELVFMTIPVLTMVILFDLWIGLIVGVFLAALYVPTVWSAIEVGTISSLELAMKLMLMFALAVGAALYKRFEEKRRERVKRLADRLQKKVDQQKDIIKAQQALGANLDLPSQLESFLHWSIRLVSASSGYIAVYDKDRERLVHSHSEENSHERPLPKPYAELIERGKSRMEQQHLENFITEMQGRRGSICVPLTLRKDNMGALCLSPEPNTAFAEEEAELISMLAVKAAIAIENAKLHELNTQLFVDSIRALAKIINTRDPMTKDHSERVAHMAGRLARKIGLRGRVLSNVVLSADLHDLGRIVIPDAILRKPGRLTKEEYDVVKKHPEAGYELLQGVRALKDVLPGIRSHHERYDGKGYPDGLKGEDIPLIARIIAVADVFEALTSSRAHRGPASSEEAAKTLREVAGSQLDPGLVNSFLITYKLDAAVGLDNTIDEAK